MIKQCVNPNCGQLNTDESAYECPYCHTPYSTKPGRKHGRKTTTRTGSQNPNPGGGKKPKLGLIAGLSAGAVALAAVVIFAVTSIFGGSSPLATAAENSFSSLSAHLDGQTNLTAYTQIKDSLDATSNRSIFMSVQTPDLFLSLNANSAGSKKLMTGSVEFNPLHSDFQFNADFHANKKELRIYAHDLVSDVYGFKFSDFEKKYDKSEIRKLLQLPAAADMKLAPFQGFNLKQFLREQGGDSWTEFEKSLEVEKFGTEYIESRNEDCTVYRVKWDQAKAERMIKTIAKNTLGVLPSMVTDLAGKLAPDVRFYVNADDELVGVDFSLATGVYVFLLEGDDNLWEQVSLTITAPAATPVRYSGGVTSDSGSVRIELKAQDQSVYAISYNNNTGAYSIVTPTQELASGIFLSDSTGYQLQCNISNFSYTLSVSQLDRIPEDTKEKYVELFDLSIPESVRMITEICTNLNITEDTLGNLFGSLFGG